MRLYPETAISKLIESETSESSEEVQRGILLSLVIHLGILLFFVSKAIFFQEEVVDYGRAIRVDIVGLPEKVKQLPGPKANDKERPVEKIEKPVTEKSEVAKPIEETKLETPQPSLVAPLPDKKIKDHIKLEKAKADQAKQKAAFEKLKVLSALEKIKEELAKEKKGSPKETQSQIDGTGRLLRGNILAPGTELEGLDKIQHLNYTADLDRHVKQFWALPEWLNKKGFKAQVLVRIDEQGQVISREIKVSSQNPQFDESCFETIDRANPLPAPPEKLTAKVRIEGILIGFGDW